MIETRSSSMDMAARIATRPLLLSLMREWRGWRMETGCRTTPASGNGAPRPASRLLLPLPTHDMTLAIAVSHVSAVGCHGFRPPFYEIRASGAERAIPFTLAATLIATEPTITGDAGATNAVTFLARVLDSLANIDDVVRVIPERYAPVGSQHAGQEARHDGGLEPDFITGEQALRYGHAVHPTPRSRDEFSLDDSRRFAAEYAAGFQLRWWSVAPENVVHGSSRHVSAPAMVRDLIASDDGIDDAVRQAEHDGRIILPMHPWQASRLMLDDDIMRLAQTGAIVDLGPSGAPWFATSSLRAIYAAHAPWMLKTSLSLRLTNSKRLIEQYECVRGLEVDRLLNGLVGQQIFERFPHFRVMGEPGYIALRHDGGPVLPTAIMAFRENPFQGEAAPAAMVLAALAEIGGDGRDSRLAHIVIRIARDTAIAPHDVAVAWFDRFLSAVVAPLLTVQADYGLLFGAHQQNIVVGLREGWPETLYFRDCQGTGYVSEFLPALSRQAPGVNLRAGHIFSATEAARLAGYYLIVNSVFAVISALVLAGFVTERVLLTSLRALLLRLRALPLSDPTCIDYLLTSPTLESKGNFMICFRNLNENTDVTDPLAGYVSIANPIAEVAA